MNISETNASQNQPTAKSPFRISDICFSIASIAAILLLVESSLGYIRNLAITESQGTLLLFIIQEIILLLPVLILLRFRYRAPLRSLGLYSFPWRRGVWCVIRWYVLYIIFSIILGFILQFFQFSIPGYGEGRSIVPLFGNDQFTLLSMIAVICVIAPVAEEIFFRGFIFRTLLKHSNHYLLSSVITATIFSLVHFDPGAFLPRLLLGLILNELVMKNRQSIGPAILFHILNNSIALGIQLNL